MRQIFFYPFFHTLVFSVKAGGEFVSSGARIAGLGHAGVALSDLYSLNYNQAGLAHLKTTSVGISSEQPYLLKPISLSALALAIPTKSGTIGFIANYYGYAYYNDTKLGIAYAKAFGTVFSIGLQLDYLRTAIAGSGSVSLFTFEIGLQAKVNSQLTFGSHIYNPVRIEYQTEQQDRVPSIFRLGLAYTPNNKVSITTEVEKNAYDNLLFKSGIEYKVVEQLCIRTGIGTNPLYNTVGIGLYLKKIFIDMAVSMHSTLGYTPHFGLRYAISK